MCNSNLLSEWNKVIFSLFLPILCCCAPLQAEPWTQFRNAQGNAISSETNLPSTWSHTDGLAWVVKIAGRGNSSPAVGTDRVDITTQETDHSLWLVSIDKTMGTIKQRTKIAIGAMDALGPKHLYKHRHNAATPSPIIDGQRTIVFFGTGDLACVEAKTGDIVWRRHMPSDFGKYDITFGMSSSPRVWHDLVFISCLTKAASYVVALNKSNGKVVWHLGRHLGAKYDAPDAYSSPTICESNQRPMLLVSGANHVTGYEPTTGKRLWIADGLGINSPHGRVIASPVAVGGIVVATSANPAGGGVGRVIAFPSTMTGRIKSQQHLWELQKSTPDVSTPVCYRQKVFMVSHHGIASCVDLKTGQIYWQRRLPKGPYFSSVVAGDEKVYFLSVDGTCTVVKATSKFERIAENQLDGSFYATAAISDGRIYLRSHERLFAIGSK